MNASSLRRAGLALLLGLGLAAAPARAQTGLSVGPNYNELSDIEGEDGGFSLDQSNGWHAELWFDIPIGGFTLRPGVRYLDAGALYEGVSDGSGVSDDFDIHFLEIPLNARLRLNLPLAKPYVVGGPVVRFPIFVDDGIQSELESASVAGGVGAGLEIPLAGWVLFPEIVYTFGLSSYAKEDFNIGPIPITTDDSQYVNTVLVRLGITLGFWN